MGDECAGASLHIVRGQSTRQSPCALALRSKLADLRAAVPVKAGKHVKVQENAVT